MSIMAYSDGNNLFEEDSANQSFKACKFHLYQVVLSSLHFVKFRRVVSLIPVVLHIYSSGNHKCNTEMRSYSRSLASTVLLIPDGQDGRYSC